MPAPIIQTQALARIFKNNRAVVSLDLKIAPGELFGLVGPDGAGKTTTLRLLAGLLDITSGEAQVAGQDLKRSPEQIKSKIGYMAQLFSLYGELTVSENLDFFAEIYDVDQALISERKHSLLSFAGLADFKNRRASHLSGGMQKKLALACTLIHEPEILFLDEPTTGVDPVSRREFWNILTELHLQGTTIVCTTPYMDEADRCSRVGLMYAGEMVICDTPANIRQQIEGEWLELHAQDSAAAKSVLSEAAFVYEIQNYGKLLHLRVDAARRALPKIKRVLRNNNLAYKHLRQVPTRMEQAFISIIRKTTNEGL